MFAMVARGGWSPWKGAIAEVGLRGWKSQCDRGGCSPWMEVAMVVAKMFAMRWPRWLFTVVEVPTQEMGLGVDSGWLVTSWLECADRGKDPTQEKNLGVVSRWLATLRLECADRGKDPTQGRGLLVTRLGVAGRGKDPT